MSFIFSPKNSKSMRFVFVFLVFVLGFASCCGDDDCNSYLTDFPHIEIEYQKSTNGFTIRAIEASHVLVINDSSELIVDTLSFEPHYGTNVHTITMYREQAKNRDMRKHRYVAQIEGISDTIKNIDYNSKKTENTCRSGCFPAREKKIQVEEYFDFQCTFRGEITDSKRVVVTK
jgi:hypothetical protein